MCGRYTLIADLGDLAQRFEFDGKRLQLRPRLQHSAYRKRAYGEECGGSGGGVDEVGADPLLGQGPEDRVQDDQRRAETVAEKPAFRNALKKRRCLVLADGYYEWQKTPTGKRPYRIIMKSGEPFAMAGLWETWKDPQGNVVPSCTIITTTSNDFLAPIHNRMPVILPRESEELWLDPSIDDPGALSSVLTPHAAEAMDAYEVSTLVNSSANNAPEAIARIATTPTRMM